MFAFRVSQFALYLAASLVFLSDGSGADDCVPLPVALSIENVTIPTGTQRRGVSLKVGTPAEDYSFLPRWNNNNTFIYGPTCDGGDLTSTTLQCSEFRGGIYKDNSSTSEGAVPQDYTPVHDPWASDTYEMFTETIALDGNYTLQEFPLGLGFPNNTADWNVQGYDPQNIIGMDTSSTLVSSLINADRIKSRSFGFFWGLDGVGSQDQSKGSFVLGGYDKAKTYGDGLTTLHSDDSNCPSKMMLAIQDIILNFSNGTDASIFPHTNGGTALLACIIPEKPVLMDMPLDPYFGTLLEYINNEEWSRTTGVDFWNVVLNPKYGIYDGDLTFKLSSNMEITIPNRQLIVPERKINEDGVLYANASRPVIRINGLQNTTSGSFPTLGRYFLTSAYVSSNDDAGKFTVWQANPTTDEDLVALDTDDNELDASASCAVQSTASAKPAEGTPTASTTSTPSATSSPVSTGLSSGAIAGIAVGIGLAALAGVGGFIWWYRRRKREQAAARQREYEDASRAYMAYTTPSPKNGFPDQGFPHYIPQELSSEQAKQAPVEMPG